MHLCQKSLHIIKISGPGLYFTLTIVFGFLFGVLLLLLATLLMKKVTKSKKNTAAVIMSKIDEEREGGNDRESESELEFEEEKEVVEAEIAAADEEYIDNTVLMEYDKTYDNHELYSK